MEIYLDNNATTMPLPEAVEAVARAMADDFGNPSSPHPRGSAARTDFARNCGRIAEFAGGDPHGLILTSGGTESNNLVFSSFRCRKPRPRIAISAAEHPSVRRPAEAVAEGGLVVLPLRSDGVLDLDALTQVLDEGLDLVSVQWASGETGVIQPVREIARICQSMGAKYHTDAAQAFGRVPLFLGETGVDLATLSGHKMHGPPGVGALWVREPRAITPAMLGGGQQDGLRSGTENTPGAAGFSAACTARAAKFGDDIERMRELRDGFEQAVLRGVPDAAVNGLTAERLCNTSSIRFGGVDGQALVAQLGRAGIMCSQTSACSSGRPEPSPTLLAMGLAEREAWSTVRFSFSAMNTGPEADAAVREIANAVSRLRSFVVF